jgi:membrane protein
MTQLPFIKLFFDRTRWPLWLQTAVHHATIYIHDSQRAELTKQASAMAYVTLFSLVPSLAAVFTLLSLFLPIFGDNANIMDQGRQFLFKYLANGSGSTVVEYLESFLAGLNFKKIGMTAFVGLLVTLVVLLRQIEEALNRIWMVHKSRPMLTRFVYFWLFLTLGMLSLSVVLGLSTGYSVTAMITKKTLAAAGKADDIFIVAAAFNWAITCVIFFLAYKVIPNCDVSNRAARGGALWAGTLFYFISKFYTLYVTNFASYKSVYGTLAALPIFLMWIYVCWVILLAGALFAWRWQKGWPPLNEDKTLESAATALDEHRNRQLRGLLPSITLVIVYDQFRAGKSVDIATLVTQLDLPHAWVSEAVDMLRDLGLIAFANLIETTTTAAESILPTRPADQMLISEVSNKFDSPLTDWLKNWPPAHSKSLKLIIARLQEGAKNTDAKTFATLLT